MKILHIQVEQHWDESPDTSYIGEYTNEWSEGVLCTLCGLPECECVRDGRVYTYFKPYAGGEKPGSKHYAKYARQDWERMEALNRGDWAFIGIKAEAQVVLSGDVVQTITSGGLWGIESNSSEEYLQEVRQEQLAELSEQLKSLGFDLDTIREAMPETCELAAE
jgi:hypothetical protein